MPDPLTPEGPYRTGRKLGRTIYNDDDILIGVMDTPELGALVVAALNAYTSSADGKVLWRGPLGVLAEADGYGLAVDVPGGTEVAVVLTGDTEVSDATR